MTKKILILFKVKQIIKNFESKKSPGKHNGDLLVDEILNLI